MSKSRLGLALSVSSSKKKLSKRGQIADLETMGTNTVTLLSAAIILAITTMEFFDYRKVFIDTSIVVDRSRGEKLTVNLNVTFPKVPCYREFTILTSNLACSFLTFFNPVLSLDIMDISGEVQRDISHNVLKVRLDRSGKEVPGSHTADLSADVEKLSHTKKEGYCGSCYGGLEPESGCCNTCEDVRMAYVNRGWSFTNPDAIEQVRS
jgi:hypothetical protein